MKLLKRMWNDVKRGENIDLYITVIIALGLAVLNVTGFAPGDWLAPINLAVLGLLAISVLGNRYRVEETLQQLTQATGSLFQEEFPSDLKTDFEAAKELWLIGATLTRTIMSNYITFEKKLREGHVIKVLLVHPEGASVQMMATRYYAPKNRIPEVQSSRGKNNLQLFCDLQKVSPGKMEIRTIETSLAFGTIAVNPSSGSGVLYLEHYPFRAVSTSLPKFVLRASDGRWYEFFKEEIQALWDAGDEWRCEENA